MMNCPRCNSEKSYHIARGDRLRCTACRYDFTFRIGTAMSYGKKPREWYEKVLELRATGLNPRQISKTLGMADAKSVYDFLRRWSAAS